MPFRSTTSANGSHRIELYFQSDARAHGHQPYRIFDSLPPIVTIEQNFDELLIPPDHVSRQPSDTYYVDDRRVLRCHTSAHQTTLLRQGEQRFLVCGDVYRRDEVDSTHYPVFHQMEGVRIFTDEEVSTAADVEVFAPLHVHLKTMPCQFFIFFLSPTSFCCVFLVYYLSYPLPETPHHPFLP